VVSAQPDPFADHVSLAVEAYGGEAKPDLALGGVV